MEKECVLLLHGLAESEFHMMPLSLALNRAGYRTMNISYPSRKYPAEQLAMEYVMPLLEELEQESVLHVVGHSMGCILFRYCMQKKRQPNLGRAIMIAPTNRGSQVLEVYRHYPLFAAWYGPAMQQSGTGSHCFPCELEDVVDYDLGIIAGGIGIDPLSWLLLSWPHDGRVSVEGTRLTGMKDHLIVPSTHEMLTFHPITLYQSVHFLKHGKFQSFTSAVNTQIGEDKIANTLPPFPFYGFNQKSQLPNLQPRADNHKVTA